MTRRWKDLLRDLLTWKQILQKRPCIACGLSALMSLECTVLIPDYEKRSEENKNLRERDAFRLVSNC
jgi:hypothetical protein|uniref:Uncharacterized protein n=1 Tax=Oryza rufipogon TaxID=4529 RepID=A0A0E0PFL2_ORYRU